MAQFKHVKEGRSDLTVIEVYGDVSRGEILQFLRSNAEISDSPRAILDFRAANLSALSIGHISKAVKKLEKFTGPGFKAALVFSNPADFSIGQVISNALSRDGYLSDIRGFYNLYRAKDWLLF